MKTVQARLNWGRWIVDCPKEHNPLDSKSLEVKPGRDTQFICPACYPQSIAQFVGMVNGKIQPVPDVSARRTARRLAEEKGEIYNIIFPDNLAEIEAAVSVRPQQNQQRLQQSPAHPARCSLSTRSRRR